MPEDKEKTELYRLLSRYKKQEEIDKVFRDADDLSFYFELKGLVQNLRKLQIEMRYKSKHIFSLCNSIKQAQNDFYSLAKDFEDLAAAFGKRVIEDIKK